MIEAKNISKIYSVYNRPRHWLIEKVTGKKMGKVVTALKDVNLVCEKGSCVGIVGTNGAGKSTLLRVLAGISEPTCGEVNIEGRLSAILELDSGFHPEFTGRENIKIGSKILGLSPDEAKEKEGNIIEFSGLEEFIDLPVRTYSSGMYLRLGFALATSVDPEVLLIDEALAVGDEWFRGKCVDRIKQIKKGGASIVIVSHDLTMVRALCDKAVLLDKGEVVDTGVPGDVINSYLAKIYTESARKTMTKKTGRR